MSIKVKLGPNYQLIMSVGIILFVVVGSNERNK